MCGEAMDEKFFEGISKNIREYFEKNPTGKPLRKILPVGFVRQHNMTCAPATLSTLSAYWGRKVAHLDIAKEICYDGSTAHSEREWAFNNGYCTREFDLNWETAKKLINLNAPFTLATASASSGHLQAVIGYDEAKKTLLVRDPFVRKTLEFNIENLLESNRFTGPRCMLMTPEESAENFRDLDLPAAELYDRLFRVETCLKSHLRSDAKVELELLMKEAPNHRLTFYAQLSLAHYDGNLVEALEVIESLIDLFPDAARYRLMKLSYLRSIGSREHRLSWLETCNALPDAHPMYKLELVRELSADDRELDRVSSILRRVSHRMADSLEYVFEYARYLWISNLREESLEYYRLAACLGDMRENFSQSYFNISRMLGHHEEALSLLNDRVQRLRYLSFNPVVSLFDALDALGRTQEAFDLLNETINQRPDDPELALFSARKHCVFGFYAKSRELLEKSRSQVKTTDWLSESSRLLYREGHLERALEELETALEVDPLSMDSRSRYIQLLADCKGKSEALKSLKSACEKFPHHLELHRIWYEWTNDSSIEMRFEVLEKVLRIDGYDAWALREKAYLFLHQAKFDAALKQIQEAIHVDAANPAGYVIQGRILQGQIRSQEAHESFKKAVTLSADHSGAILGLVETCANALQARKEAIKYVEQEMIRQTLNGEGLLVYRDVARGILTPEELLISLEKARAERPDLWHAWAAVIRHLKDMQRLDLALERAQEATTKFPLLPVVWLDLSAVHKARNDSDEEIEALNHCLEINRDFTTAILSLSEAHLSRGRLDDARVVLEKAIVRSPGEAVLKGSLADIVFKQGDTQMALDLAREAVELNPNYDWAWSALQRWNATFKKEGEKDLAIRVCSEIAEERPGEIQWWMRLALLHYNIDDYKSALEALDHVLKINPVNLEGLDLSALALSQLGQFKEAEAICSTTFQDGRIPVQLQCREAWVDALRGERTLAISKIRKVLDDNPDLDWGWSLLVQWLSENKDYEEAIKAAEQWVWLCPSEPRPLGWLGNARVQMDQKKEAIQLFQRALRLDTSYLYAARQLFELHIKTQQFVEAQRLLDQMSLEMHRSEILALRVQLNIATRRFEEVFSTFEQVCRSKEVDSQVLDETAELLRNVSRRKLSKAFKNILKSSAGAFHPHVPYLWSEFQVSRNRRGGYFAYSFLKSLGEPGRNGLHPFLNAMGNDRSLNHVRPLNRFRIFLVRQMFKEEMYTDNNLWGKIGYLLVGNLAYKKVVRHMADWRTRENVEGWMFHNLTLGYLMTRQDLEASEIMRLSIERPAQFDESASCLRIWAAIDGCNKRDFQLTQNALHLAPEEMLDVRERALRKFAELALSILSQPAGKRKFMPQEKDTINQAWKATANSSDRRLVRRCVGELGKHTKSFKMTLTALWDSWSKPIATGVMFFVLAGSIGLAYSAIAQML